MDSFVYQIQQTSLVEWLGTVCGLLGVSLSIRENVLAWPFFILCYGLYAFLSYTAALYAAMALNACFIPVSIYGWWQWAGAHRSDKQALASSELRIRRMPVKAIVAVPAIALLGTALIGTLLVRYTDGAAPYLDAFATTLSLLAQWMLGRKYIENWLAWISADLAFVFLWGGQGYWVAVAMFLVFIVLAIIGYTSWRKEIRSDAA